MPLMRRYQTKRLAFRREPQTDTDDAGQPIIRLLKDKVIGGNTGKGYYAQKPTGQRLHRATRHHVKNALANSDIWSDEWENRLAGYETEANWRGT
jgi:hypothetical protein